jgi:hypothetical protein
LPFCVREFVKYLSYTDIDLIFLTGVQADQKELKMNAFERFDAILSHQKPDKLPFYFPTIACSVASEILGRPVYSGGDSLHFAEERSWLQGVAAHDEFVQRYREDAIELNRKLGADLVRQTWRSSARPTRAFDDYTLLFGEENGPHLIKRFFPEHQSYGVVENTRDAQDVDALRTELKQAIRRDPAISDDELAALYHSQIEFKVAAADYFPTLVGGLSLDLPIQSVAWLEATVLEPDLLAEYFMVQARIWVQHVRFLAAQGFRWINGGGDLASNHGTIVSPSFFRTALVPALQLITGACARHGIVYCYRTDGNIWSIVEDLFDVAGVLAFGEVDRDAGMTVGELRRRFPRLLILGNNSSNLLHKGSEAQVRQQTRQALIESGGSHYIAGPSNAIMHGTPVGNLFAMIDEIGQYRPGESS